MIDIHCHPLPGTDDGAKTFEMAFEMCQIAAADGITHLVATPHSNYRYTFNAEANRAKLAKLQEALGPQPKLLHGCDFHLSYDNLDRLQKNRTDFTINATQYLLVEFAEHFIAEQMDNVFYEIEVAGVTPILTHPERNRVFHHNPGLLYHWATRGCLVQLTAQSCTGVFGATAQRLCDRWLEQNLVHFFASDAHDPDHRPPILSECYQRVAGLKGQEVAELLMVRNPEAVINGQALPPQPEAIEQPAPARKRAWLSFFRRS